MISAGTFVHLSRDIFGGMLMRHDLGMSELQLFKLVLTWGAHQCTTKHMINNNDNMKVHVKDLLPLIRFPLMSVDELIHHVKPTELLSDDVLAAEITAKTTYVHTYTPHDLC
jgi:hypothetical protein